MSTAVQFALANGVYTFPVESAQPGVLNIGLSCPIAPSAGLLKIEGSPYNQPNTWRQIGGASALDLSTLAAGPLAASDWGQFSRLRFTLSGVTGGTGPILATASLCPSAVPQDIFSGFRAMNVQTYVESNVKLGSQFYCQVALAPIDHGTSFDAVFTVGAVPVLIKDRQVYGSGNSWSYQVFKNPTFSGGVAVPIYNFNDINPGTSLVTLKAGVTVTATGTSWGDPQRVYGSSSASNRVGQGLVPGGDRVLKPGSSYLVRFNNFDTTSGAAGQANIDYFLSWYEGNPDLPRS